METKLTPELIVQIQEGSADPMDLILELHLPISNSGEMMPPRKKINVLKGAFERQRIPVEDAILKAGGQVTGRAWINQVVRARVPANRIEQVASLDEVAAVDVPHTIKADFG